MPGKNVTLASYSSLNRYRYAFNGQEHETEIKQGTFFAEYWMYSSQLGRRWNTDPVVKPQFSSYSTFANNPILFIDPNGDDWYDNGKGQSSWREGNDKSYKSSSGETWTNTGEFHTSNETIDGTMYTTVMHQNKTIYFGEGLSQDYKTAITKSSAPKFNGSFDTRKNGVGLLLPRVPELSTNNFENSNIVDEWTFGAGPQNSLFLDDHPITNSLKGWSEVDRLRFLAYQKFEQIKNDGYNVSALYYSPYTNFGNSFTPLDALDNGAGQVVGSFSGDVFPSKDGKTLIFVVSDEKSRHSFYLHAVQSINRISNVITPEGNTVQKYIWTEPYDPSWYNSQKDKRNSKNGELK